MVVTFGQLLVIIGDLNHAVVHVEQRGVLGILQVIYFICVQFALSASVNA